jgi:WXXGXW repeat (2 copies)
VIFALPGAILTFMRRHRWFRTLLASSLFAVGGCVIAPDQRHYADGVVMVAPPAPRLEVIGEPPRTGYVWIGGYWSWVGNRHEWVPGHWAAPHAGHHWVAYQWVRQGDGWRLKGGRWERG